VNLVGPAASRVLHGTGITEPLMVSDARNDAGVPDWELSRQLVGRGRESGDREHRVAMVGLATI